MNAQEFAREEIRRVCVERGIAILPLSGTGFRLVGRGVDILTADLANVRPRELSTAANDELGE